MSTDNNDRLLPINELPVDELPVDKLPVHSVSRRGFLQENALGFGTVALACDPSMLYIHIYYIYIYI